MSSFLTVFDGVADPTSKSLAGERVSSIDSTVRLIVSFPVSCCRQISSGSTRRDFSHGLQDFRISRKI